MEIDLVEPYICLGLTSEELRNEPYWAAKLSTGPTVYSKHNRRSWLELKEWLKINPEVYIERLDFYFRDNHVHIATDKDGYFFSQGIQCWYGGTVQPYYVGGWVTNNILYRIKYIVPEMVHLEHEDDNYPITHPDIQRGLILNERKYY